VGPKPARVYWVRRLIVLAVILLVLILLVIFGMKLFSSDSDSSAKTDRAAAQEDETPPAPDEACLDKSVSLSFDSYPNFVKAGKKAEFEISVTNEGDHSCTVDVGARSREVVITSGSDRIWSSADCAESDDESNLVLLRPGTANVGAVKWSGERSNEQCSKGLPEPRPGNYKANVTLGEAEGTEVAFTIE